MFLTISNNTLLLFPDKAEVAIHLMKATSNFIYQHNRPLLLSEIDLNRYSRKIPLIANLILQVAAIRLLDILRQIDKERKLRRGSRQLRSVLDTDIFTLCRCGWIILNNRKDIVVKLRCRNAAATRIIYSDSLLQHLQYTLFVDYRGKDDGDIIERSQLLLQPAP